MVYKLWESCCNRWYYKQLQTIAIANRQNSAPCGPSESTPLHDSPQSPHAPWSCSASGLKRGCSSLRQYVVCDCTFLCLTFTSAGCTFPNKHPQHRQRNRQQRKLHTAICSKFTKPKTQSKTPKAPAVAAIGPAGTSEFAATRASSMTKALGQNLERHSYYNKPTHESGYNYTIPDN